MTLMIIGLILWAALHLMRSMAPDVRSVLRNKLGKLPAKMVIAVGILASVVMMVVGYRAAAFIPVWSPPAVFGHLNNLLMVFALYVYFMTATKPGTAWIMGDTKNPQLTGFTMWAVAHLLVNGDLAAMILFGGLLVWAMLELKATKNTPSLVDRDTAKISNPFAHLALVVVVFVVITGVHTALGYNPFGAL